MTLFNSILVSFLIVLFAGCGSKTPAPVKKEVQVPAWVNSVLPSDTATKMYGMSIEKNRDQAIKAALNDMVSRLGTTIESSFESNQKVENSYSNLTVKNSIKADISKIKINNYKVVKSHRIKYNEFAVMIESDKQKFMSGLKEDYFIQKKSLQQRYDALRNQDPLKRYNGKKKIAQEAQALTSTLLILSELDKSFDIKSNMSFIEEKKKAFLDESSSLRFYINGDRKSVKFADKIKNYLAQKGYNIVNSSKGAVNVKLSTSDNVNKGDISIAVLTLNVGVYSDTERIGGKIIIMKERYNSSVESVYKNAAIHFEQDIQSKGINELIGINLDVQ